VIAPLTRGPVNASHSRVAEVQGGMETTHCPECLGPKTAPQLRPLRRGAAPAFQLLCGECAKLRSNANSFMEAARLARQTIDAMPEGVRPGFQAIFDQARQFALEGRSLATTLPQFDLRKPRGLGRCLVLATIHAAEAIVHAGAGNAPEAQSSLLVATNNIGVARGLMLASSAIDKHLRSALSRVLHAMTNPARTRRIVKTSHPAALVKLLAAALQDFAVDQVPLIDRVADAAERCESAGRPTRHWASWIGEQCGCTPTQVRRLLKQLDNRQSPPTKGKA
jgi:hypothetical protein